MSISRDTHNALNAQACMNLGVSCFQEGNTREAIACFDRALASNPQYANAWYNKGVAFVSLGDYFEAITCYDNAIKFYPQYHNAWHNKGIALAILGNHAEAISCYNRAINLRPSDPDNWSRKGESLQATGNFVEARECFTKATSIGSNYILSQERMSQERAEILSLHRQNLQHGNCYIATVCYGSYDATEVVIFRHYQDEYLSKTCLGKWCIKLYYWCSPYIAKQLEHFPYPNHLVKKYILDKILQIIIKKRGILL